MDAALGYVKLRRRGAVFFAPLGKKVVFHVWEREKTAMVTARTAKRYYNIYLYILGTHESP